MVGLSNINVDSNMDVTIIECLIKYYQLSEIIVKYC